jgi:tRNA(Ile)-lysidine synthase
LEYEKIIKTAENVIQKYADLNTATLNAAFSGGSDSTALLCILLQLRKKYGFKLRALTVNYNLRGAESIRDRDFCKNFCLENDVEFFCLEVDSEKLPEKSENALRNIRYSWFESFDGCTLTAHTADDNAETLLLNLIRGTGLGGLTAIPERRGNFIRPLLSVEKFRLEAMLYEIGQNFVTDSSNLTDDYTRNKIRNRILPEIKLINVSFTEAAARLIASLKADNEYLETAAAECENIGNAPAPLRIRKLRNFFTHNNLSLDYTKISILDSAIAQKKKAKLSAGKSLFITYSPKTDELKLVEIKDYGDTQAALNPPCVIDFCDKQIKVSLNSRENFSENEIVHIKLTQCALDYDIINGIAVASLRKNGDSYRRVNRLFDSRLKTLYNENLPPEKRANNIVLRDSGGIIWCEHFGCAERVKITENTKNIMIIEVKPLENGI